MSKKTNKYYYFAALSLATVACFALAGAGDSQQAGPALPFNTAELEDKGIFFEAINDHPLEGNDNRIFAVITPHHLLAADLIAEALSKALARQPKTVILVGPNHEEAGEAAMLSSGRPWHTDAGKLGVDDAVLDRLVASGLVKPDNGVLSKDHAISNILPFIAHYSPASLVVPILLSRRTDEDQVRDLAGLLAEQAGSGALVVSSIDFSHYLDSASARRKDSETLSAIADFDMAAIFGMTNDNLDCPSCLVLPMLLNEKVGNSRLNLLRNTNSGELYGNPNLETTSYITAYYE